MSEIDLTQREADSLIVLPKKLAIKAGQIINLPLHDDFVYILVESIEKILL
jgi:hypothetical protein